MKIEIKNIKYDKIKVIGNLYINAYLAAIVVNPLANEPVLSYHSLDSLGASLVEKAERFCKTLPPLHYPAKYWRPERYILSDLNAILTDQLLNYFNKKEAIHFSKTVAREQATSILIGTPGESYIKITTGSIADLLNRPDGLSHIQNHLNNLHDGIVEKQLEHQYILNNNLPLDMILRAGFTNAEIWNGE